MRAALAILILLCATGPARAAADDTAEAKRLYQSGTRHFNLAEYEAALTDFKEGYRHKDDPVFLYNIAQCYRLLKGHEEDAVKFYRNYLREVPNAPNRDEVDKKIESLQQALAAQDTARTTPPSSTLKPSEPTTPPATTAPAVVATEAPPPPQRKPAYKQWWLWTAVGGVAAVGLGVGLGVGLSQSHSQSSLPPINY